MSPRTLTGKEALVKPEMLLIGLDLGRDHNVAVVLRATAQHLGRFRFPHTREGYDFLYRQIAQLREQYPDAGVLLGMEPTNHYWKWLAADVEARHPEYSYRLVNAYTVRKHREGEQLERAKDDVRDALQIAELLRTGKSMETQLLHGSYAQLRQYATLYQRLRRDAAQTQNLLRAAVELSFPELAQVFKDLEGATVAAMLQAGVCASQIRQQSVDEFIAAVRQHYGGQRLGTRKLGQVHELARRPVGLSEPEAALHMSIQVYAARLQFQRQQLAEVSTALAALFQTLPEAAALLSLPCMSALAAALLLAELGDPRRYSCAAQWVKLAGVQPVANSSGRRTRSRTPMSHKGRSRLREQLYWRVLVWVQHDPYFRGEYLRLQQRAEHPLTKMEAVGALMNKALHIIWALLRDHSVYDPQRPLQRRVTVTVKA